MRECIDMNETEDTVTFHLCFDIGWNKIGNFSAGIVNHERDVGEDDLARRVGDVRKCNTFNLSASYDYSLLMTWCDLFNRGGRRALITLFFSFLFLLTLIDEKSVNSLTCLILDMILHQFTVEQTFFFFSIFLHTLTSSVPYWLPILGHFSSLVNGETATFFLWQGVEWSVAQ